MKKKIYMLVLLAMASLLCYGQQKISGVYFSKSGVKLEIKNDSLRLLMPNNLANGYFGEVLAECIVTQIDNNFIELNSTEAPYTKFLKSIRMIQKTGQSSDDSIKVNFIIPYLYTNLIITVSDSNGSFSKRFFYSVKNKTYIFIPRGIKSINFSIAPENFMPHDPAGYYYGVLYVNSNEFTVKENVNFIEIEIPVIDNTFFEKYYVKGDYARIVKDTIIWKGIEYKKNRY